MGHDVRQVYQACYRRLVAQLYVVTGDLAEAQDAVQEAFVRALAKPSTFARLDNPEAWLRTVAVNVARSRWRRLRHLDRLLGRAGQQAPLGDVPGLGPDRVALMDAIRSLPPAHRVIALFYFADLPVAEIAEILRLPEGTVKTRLARGRTRLGDLLTERGATDGREWISA
ncbi:MAG: RNA polymerase sigma factor [Sporichthyaceae bacterium]|nr:RNA polymerase sigma factor [Sporichthyaceae bacterium]